MVGVVVVVVVVVAIVVIGLRVRVRVNPLLHLEMRPPRMAPPERFGGRPWLQG